MGNLSPSTVITDLKDHFSRDATKDIESVFLISKSNCAFVNYRSAETCGAAMTRFHDSRLRGARLACRLRRGSNTVAAPAPAKVQSDVCKHTTAEDIADGISPPSTDPVVVSSETFAAAPRSLPGKLASDRFFVVKSLTVEDLERSVVSGTWATQAHNEEHLNDAFEESFIELRFCAYLI